ncbi:MAG: 4-hydroxy-3-methylbut-2-enyl diphosphate reductase [Lachnospiraceae bacterium]|nr:4-hydroxy-3-methylbut-2-enyl diphosphate reductase [Lachnospiraceae bacterium]
MRIVTAESAGFCFGVERAVSETLRLSETGEKPVFTYGPVVHNETVVRTLEERGVRVLESEADLEALDGGTVVIRAHGIPKETEEKLKRLPVAAADMTCPFVKKIHRIVSKHSALGETVVIAGDAEHPEVKGILGWCGGPAAVIRTAEELEETGISKETPLCLVAQTTFNWQKYKILVEKILKSGYNVIYTADTVCNATAERQKEAEKIASDVDMMLVIGSPGSSNTRKLFEICSKKCNRSYFIRNAGDLRDSWFTDVTSIGITAGASTPKKILREVQTYVRKF